MQRIKHRLRRGKRRGGGRPRIGDSHFEINHSNYRGYGGSCFPKDVNALLQLAEKENIPLELLQSMRKVNRKLLKDSGLDESYFLKELHKKRQDKKKL